MIGIKNIFGYYPGNIFLYKLAFRHRSVAQQSQNGNKVNNERLEYLGDAILGAIVAEYLYKMFPYKDEGFLTEMRSKMVSRVQLNKLSHRLGIDGFIQTAGENNNHFRSIKGDAFEALIGAIYLDKGYNFTKKIVIGKIIKFYFDLDDLENTDTNFKSKLIEWSQREKKAIEFVVIAEKGTGYNKQYVVEVRIDKIPYGEGCDFSIKGAEQGAAEKTWNSINGDNEV
ncbi:MAG: ribonuclease III [Bacteroidota bacterium]|nr:ribonuclease III [Bacteroidota bacterium]